LSFANVLMPIDARTARGLGIVEMNCGQTIVANDVIEFAKCFPYRGLAANVVAGGENVRGVKANTEPFGFAHIINDMSEMFETIAETRSLTRGRLQCDFGFHFRNRSEHAIDRLHDFRQARFLARAKMRPRMQHEKW
jgi:hypothetical protein